MPELALAPVDHAVDHAADHLADHSTDTPADRPSVPDAVPNAKPAFAARIAPGAFVGLTSRGDLLYGGRVVLNAAPLGLGWLRAVPVFRRWSGVFPDDAYREFTTTSFGATLEYAMPINPNLFVAGGIGIGIESQDDAYHNHAYFYVPALRITPTAHYDRFEVWVGYELGIGSGPTGMGGAYQSSDRSIELSHRFELGLDFYVW